MNSDDKDGAEEYVTNKEEGIIFKSEKLKITKLTQKQGKIVVTQ